MTGSAVQPPQHTPPAAPRPGWHDPVRYDVTVETNVDPAVPGVTLEAGPHCRCRAGGASGPCTLGVTGHDGREYLAAVDLPVGDCRTTVYAAATARGTWRLLIRRFPGRFGASATLMAITEQLRHTLQHARVTPTYIAASTANPPIDPPLNPPLNPPPNPPTHARADRSAADQPGRPA